MGSDQLSKATLYVVRRKRGSPRGGYVFGLAKPCEGCQRCIGTFGISKVVHSTEGGISCL